MLLIKELKKSKYKKLYLDKKIFCMYFVEGLQRERAEAAARAKKEELPQAQVKKERERARMQIWEWGKEGYL